MNDSRERIISRALSKMREYDFVDLDEYEIDEMLDPFLTSAESEFARVCEESLEKDKSGEYVNSLSEECIEILALGVVAYWITAYAADADKMRNALGTKDYSLFSPANLLSTVEEVRKNFLMDFQTAINKYSFIHGNLFRDGKRA